MSGSDERKIALEALQKRKGGDGFVDTKP